MAVSVTAAPLPVPVGEPPLLVVETPDLDTSKTPLSLNCPVFFSSKLSALMLYLPAVVVVELSARGWNPGMTKLTRSYFPAAVSTLAAMGSCVSGVVVLSTRTRANWDGSVETEVQVMALVEDRSQVVVVVGEVRRRAVGVRWGSVGVGGEGDHVPEAVERRAARVRVFILAGDVVMGG